MATRTVRVCDVLGTSIKDGEEVYTLSAISLSSTGCRTTDGGRSVLFSQHELSEISQEGAERLVKILNSLKDPIKRRKKRAPKATPEATA